MEGHPIAGDFARVHLGSRDSQELYVELGLLRSRTPQDEYDQHRPSLERRFGAKAVTPLSETRVGDRIAWTYSFRWDEGERVVLLLYAEPDTYRVVYDPRSSLNGDVLDTLTILE